MTWLEIPGTGMAFVEGSLAILIEFPGPARIVLLGRLVVQVPPKDLRLLHLQVDALGSSTSHAVRSRSTPRSSTPRRWACSP